MSAHRWSGVIGLTALALTACGSGSTPGVVSGGAPGNQVGSGSVVADLIASVPQPSADEQKILDDVNAARAQPRDCDSTHRYGAASPLTWNAQLAGAALAHSQDMAQNGYNEADPHAGSDGNSAQQRIERAGYTNWSSNGENVAAGYTVGGPNDVVAAWLASPGHCENIMNPQFREIGISFVALRGARYNGFFTQDFGSK